jgi:hypothetical protein
MVSGLALNHGASVVGALRSADPGDPRLGRMQVIGFANQLSDLTGSDPVAATAFDRLHKWVASQSIDGDIVAQVGPLGYPKLLGFCETPANLPYGVLRLQAQAALNRPDFSTLAATTLSTGSNFSAMVDSWIENIEAGFVSGVALSAARTAHESSNFSTRLNQSIDDLYFIGTSGQIRPYSAFVRVAPSAEHDVSAIKFANSSRLPLRPDIWKTPVTGNGTGDGDGLIQLCTFDGDNEAQTTFCLVVAIVLAVVAVAIIIGGAIHDKHH